MRFWLAKIARRIRHVPRSVALTAAAVLYLLAIFYVNLPGTRRNEKGDGETPRPTTVSIASSLKQQVTFSVPPMFLSSTDPNKHVPIEVPLLNDTEQEVRFISVQTSSGCAQATLAEDFLPPGGTSKLLLDIRPSLGNRLITCLLTTANGGPCQLVIDLSLSQRLMFSVADLGLGKQPPKSMIRRSLSLRMIQTIEDAKPWKLESLTSDSSHVSANVREPTDSTCKNGVCVRDYDIELTMDTGLPDRSYRTALTAKAVAPSGESVIATLPVRWKTERIYNIQPASAFFNLRTIQTASDQPLCCTLSIERADGTAPTGLTIRSVSGLDGAEASL